MPTEVGGKSTSKQMNTHANDLKTDLDVNLCSQSLGNVSSSLPFVASFLLGKQTQSLSIQGRSQIQDIVSRATAKVSSKRMSSSWPWAVSPSVGGPGWGLRGQSSSLAEWENTTVGSPPF